MRTLDAQPRQWKWVKGWTEKEKGRESKRTSARGRGSHDCFWIVGDHTIIHVPPGVRKEEQVQETSYLHWVSLQRLWDIPAQNL